MQCSINKLLKVIKVSAIGMTEIISLLQLLKIVTD